MPLTSDQWVAYGPGWREFSDGLRFGRADGRCECTGECGSPRHLGPDRCLARHGLPSPLTTNPRVVLTVAHLDRADPLDTRDPERVRVFCELCHLSYDRELHADTAARNRASAATAPLPADPCTCGDSRNHHSGYGLGRCLRLGCPCQRLTPPASTDAKDPT